MSVHTVCPSVQFDNILQMGHDLRAFTIKLMYITKVYTKCDTGCYVEKGP